MAWFNWKLCPNRSFSFAPVEVKIITRITINGSMVEVSAQDNGSGLLDGSAEKINRFCSQCLNAKCFGEYPGPEWTISC